MKLRTITAEHAARFSRHLREQERSPGTVEKYTRDVRALATWLNGAPATHGGTAAWRDGLLDRGYAPVTVNSMVAAVNHFFTSWVGRTARSKP